MINLSSRAIEKLKEIADDEGITKLQVRAKVLGSGCNGFSFDLCFDASQLETDEIEVVEDISIVMDQMSFQYLEDITINYVDSVFGGGFKFEGGQIKSTCGCGNSVGF